MKFLLIIQICSLTHTECIPPQKIYPMYNSHYDCSTGGYLRGLTIIRELGQKEVDKAKIYVNFSCQQLNYS